MTTQFTKVSIGDGLGTGNLASVDSNNALAVNVVEGAITAENPSVSLTGATAPLYGTEVAAQYNTSAPTPTNGQLVALQTDSQGDLKTYLASLIYGEDATNNVLGEVNKIIIGSTYSPSIDTSFGTAVTHNSKATAGQLLSFNVTSINAAIRYFQLFNSTGSTSTVLLSFPIPAGTATQPSIFNLGSDFFSQNGFNFSTGITWGVSTTQTTYTGATNTDHNVIVTYV